MDNPQFKVIVRSPGDVSSTELAAWMDLEARASQANAYLSPLFVMPAIKYLDPDASIIIVFVKKSGTDASDLYGVGVFRERRASRQFPLPHLIAYKSIHSYLTGFLIDKDFSAEVLECLFGFIAAKTHHWHGLVSEAEFAKEEPEQVSANECGVNWLEFGSSERAILIPKACYESMLSNLPKNTRKNYQRRLRRLEAIGKTRWQCLTGDEINETVIANFIELENMGWKGKAGTSLASCPEQVSFFQEMIKGFREQNRVFFTELSVDDEVIASTSNLISGNAGFAFKLGWNVDYAKVSPGVLNEIGLIKHCAKYFGGLDFIDSGAAENSFIEKIWPWKRNVVSGVYATTKIGTSIARNMIRLKKLIR